MFNKKKNDLNQIKILYKILEEKISNKDILDYILGKIYLAAEDNNIKYINETGVFILDKKTNDTFLVSIEEKQIRTEYTCWNNRHVEKKLISFEEDKIVLNEFETDKIVSSNEKELLSIERRQSTKVYRENQLSYKHTFESSTSLKSEDYDSYSKEVETHIDETKKAVEKTTTVGDFESFYKTETTYAKTDFLDTPPFNSRFQNKGIYIYGMSTCTKEEYDEFINNLNNSYDIKKLRKCK